MKLLRWIFFSAAMCPLVIKAASGAKLESGAKSQIVGESAYGRIYDAHDNDATEAHSNSLSENGDYDRFSLGRRLIDDRKKSARGDRKNNHSLSRSKDSDSDGSSGSSDSDSDSSSTSNDDDSDSSSESSDSDSDSSSSDDSDSSSASNGSDEDSSSTSNSSGSDSSSTSRSQSSDDSHLGSTQPPNGTADVDRSMSVNEKSTDDELTARSVHGESLPTDTFFNAVAYLFGAIFIGVLCFVFIRCKRSKDCLEAAADSEDPDIAMKNCVVSTC